MTKFPIIDLFSSIQGEGVYVGVPSIFIRTTGCNLKCVFSNSICDTAYSSFFPEESKYNYCDVRDIIVDNPNINHIVITGGEPLMRSTQLINLLDYLYSIDLLRDMTITIETNGTFPPLDLSDREYRINLYSVSLKLSTSVPKEPITISIGSNQLKFDKNLIDRLDKTRYNPRVIEKYTSLHFGESQFKFVYSGEDSIKEILKIKKECYLSDSVIMLMPEGQTEEILQNNRREAAEYCIEFGWRYTDRLHIMIWNDERGY